MLATISYKGKDKDGIEIWRIRIYVDGKQASKNFHGTHKQAEKFATELERNRETLVVEPIQENPRSAGPTVAQYLEEWLEVYQKPEVAPYTWHENARKLRNHVIPYIGEKSLNELSVTDLQRVINDLAAKHPRTAVMTYTIVKKAFRHAFDIELLEKNPAERLKKPKAPTEERPFLTPEQAQQFLEAAKSSRYYGFFAFLLMTGCRPEEALALKWEDIDFQHRKVAIRRALRRITGGHYEVAELKTSSSKRNIDIGEWLSEILQTHQQAQLEERKQKGTAYRYEGYVFASGTGATSDLANVRRREFRKIIKAAGLPSIRMYDLRHTHGSILLAQGIPVKAISERLGHASVTMTLERYLHVQDSLLRDAVGGFEQSLKPGSYDV